MSQLLGTFSQFGNVLKIGTSLEQEGYTKDFIGYNLPSKEIGRLGKNSGRKIKSSLIEDAKKMALETGYTVCIYDSSDIEYFIDEEKSSIRSNKIDYLINNGFTIGSPDILFEHSIPTYYDTETDSLDILSRHQIVHEFLNSIGFEFIGLSDFVKVFYSEFDRIEGSTRMECSFNCDSIPGVIIKLNPNLTMQIRDYTNIYMNTDNNSLYFNRIELINKISKLAPLSWKRDQKIGKILNI